MCVDSKMFFDQFFGKVISKKTNHKLTHFIEDDGWDSILYRVLDGDDDNNNNIDHSWSDDGFNRALCHLLSQLEATERVKEEKVKFNKRVTVINGMNIET